MAASPSSGNTAAAAPSSEEVKPNPYQKFGSGPKGAYEARQIIPALDHVSSHLRGLYVRVDMPGVPDDGVKVVKKPDSRTVTFTGKALPPWNNVDSSDRVYAGYVVLDRDLDDVPFDSYVKDGCFRFFFPDCDGSLHFLSPPINNGGDNDNEDDNPVEYSELRGTRIKNVITYIEHPPKGESGIRFSGGKQDDINPYVLSGPKSCYEHKAVHIGGEEVVYVRLDVPGVNWQAICVSEVADRSMLFSADGVDRGCAFDKSSRHYMGTLIPKCSCCRYKVVKHDLTNGVLRFIARKVRHNARLIPPSVMHYYEGPLKPISTRFTVARSE